jgi:hypothetical protein
MLQGATDLPSRLLLLHRQRGQLQIDSGGIDHNIIIEKEFGVTRPVDWCEGGITAGVDDIREEIAIKA